MSSPSLGSSSGGRIRSLDPGTIALLRSGVHLPSLAHVVQCLIRVALDGGCRSVSCSVDQDSGFVCVDDDGLGLERRSVHQIAKDQPAATQDPADARAAHVLTHAQRRVFDALAYVSLLDICSRTADSPETHQTVFKDGEIVFSGPAKTSRRHIRGTTVTVRNLFYNLPVRTGHDRQNSHQLKRQWDECHRSIQYFAICYPHTTFKLRSAPQSLDRLPGDTHSSFKDSGIRISKTDNSVTTFGKIFGQALIRNAHVIESCNVESFHVQGFLGRHHHLNKSCQLIFRNSKIIPATSSIHKNLQKLLAQSPNSKSAFLDPNTASSLSSSMRKSQRKSVSPSKPAGSVVQHHPVYLLIFTSDVEDPLSASNLGLYEEHLSPRTEEVLSNISAFLCERFLPAPTTIPTTTSKNIFAGAGAREPQNRHIAKRNSVSGSEGPKKRSKLASSPTNSFRPPSDLSLSSRAPTPVQAPFSFQNSHSLVSQLSSGKLEGHEGIMVLPENVGKQNMCSWTDPKTKQTFEINTITGFSTPVTRLSEGGRKPVSTDVSSSQSLGRLKLVNSRERVQEAPTWITGGLADYESPVFGQQSRRTHGDSLSSESYHRFSTSSTSDLACCDPTQASSSAALNPRARLTQMKEAAVYESCQAVDLSVLAGDQFRVVGQADDKFIVVLLLNSQLVLVFDQHAVHERIRVEGFLEKLLRPELLTVQTLNSQNSRSRIGEDATKGVPVLVSGPELRKFKRWQARFRRWGFIYELSEDRSNADVTLVEEELEQIVVLNVPELLAKRLERDHGLLVEVLRGCACFFDENVDEIEESWDRKKVGSLSENLVKEQNGWFGRLSNCPPVLVDLINSKACRGAVMFGDRLEWKECEEMINRLGSTYLPFQCAHGRPTCVPVLGLGPDDQGMKGQMEVQHVWDVDYNGQSGDTGYGIDWKAFLET